LDAHRVALARAIPAAAGARIVDPVTWRAANLAARRSRHAVLLSIPVSALDLDRLGVLDRLADHIANFAGLGLPHWLADRVLAGLGFPDRLAHRVANLAGLGLPARFADRVGAGLGFPDRLADRVLAGLGFPDWLAHCIANLAGLGFPHGLAHGVVASAGFPHRLAHRIADVLRVRFPDWLANRVIAGAGFPHRLANCIANLFRTCFRDPLGAVNHAVFTHAIPAGLVAGDFLLFVFDASNRLHHRVALHLATRCATAIARHTAEPGVCFGRGQREH
jgi:hypothetical protein